MGIKQEVRVEGRKPVVETTAYGAKVVKSSTEGIKDQPADDAAGQDGADAAPAVTKASELFSKLISGIVDGGKAMPAQKDIEEFGKRCETFVEANGGSEPDGDTILGFLREVGITDVADAFEKVLAGADVEAVLAELPAAEPADENANTATVTDGEGDGGSDTEGDDADGDSEGGDAEPADEGDKEPENETDGEGNDEAGDNPPMNDESAEKPVDGTAQPEGKKRGRPAKKDVEQ